MATNVGLKGEKIIATIDGVQSGNCTTNDAGEGQILNQTAGKTATVSSEAFPTVKTDVLIPAKTEVTASLNFTTVANVDIPFGVYKKDGTTGIGGIAVSWGRKGKKLKTSAPSDANGKGSILACLPGVAVDNALTCTVAEKPYTINAEIKTGMPEVKIITDVEGDIGSIKVIAFIVVDGNKIEFEV